MKIVTVWLVIGLGIACLSGCAPLVHHADPFYNFSRDDFPRDHLPLIAPIEATRERPSSPWELGLGKTIWVRIPNSNNVYYAYSLVEEVGTFAVKDGVIVAHSSYVDKQADPYIQSNFSHWFVMIPSKDIAVGFPTEDEFNHYIQTLGIQSLDWQTPEEAFDKFAETGCLEWIPDCS